MELLTAALPLIGLVVATSAAGVWSVVAGLHRARLARHLYWPPIAVTSPPSNASPVPDTWTGVTG